MSVIVKGRNMPRHCGECACSNYYDQIDALLCDFTEKQLDEKTWKKERHPDCPLIELPPHGRLGDLDALVKDLAVYRCGHNEGYGFDGGMYEAYNNSIELAEEAPTVIEAEGEI